MGGGASLCTGPDLGFDSTGSLRVTAARWMPLPAALAGPGPWINGLRMDAANGAWAAQCDPRPVSVALASIESAAVPAGTLAVLLDAALAFPALSAAQNTAFLGDVEFDALVYTRGSANAELWGRLQYAPYPGGPAVSTPYEALDGTSPGITVTPAQAAAGAASFAWRAQAKVGLGLWTGPLPAQASVTVTLGVKNVLDAAPSTPLPLQVASWAATLTGVAWLIDPTPPL